jgi:hypothetical protein
MKSEVLYFAFFVFSSSTLSKYFAIIVIDILTEICEKVVVPNRVFRLSDANV